MKSGGYAGHAYDAFAYEYSMLMYMHTIFSIAQAHSLASHVCENNATKAHWLVSSTQYDQSTQFDMLAC